MAFVFNISVLEDDGSVSVRQLRAENETQAQQQVASRGATILRCEKAPSDSGDLKQRLGALLSSSKQIDSVTFSQDMSTLISAGVSVKEAIAALNQKGSAQASVLDALSTFIAQGLSFSSAMSKTGAFPELLIATVSASEETGDLATGLARYAKHQEGIRFVRDKVVGACVYPLLLLAVGSLVIALLLGVVVPKFSTLISSTGRELPLLSKVLMGWGRFVDSNPWVPLVLFAGLIATYLWILATFNNPDARKRLLNALPGVANVVREFQHLQMYRTTAILTSRGITIHRALVYSFEFLNAQDQLRLRKALDDMRDGQRVSASLEASGLSDQVATSMLNVAENTGSMSEMLDRIADFYERTLQRNIDIVSRLIEPILMIIFGFIIGGIVVLMYLPIFDLAASIS